MFIRHISKFVNHKGNIIKNLNALNLSINKFSTEVASDDSTPNPIMKTLVKHPYILLSSSPDIDSNAKFAVVEFSGTQYKVAVNDTVVTDFNGDVDIDDEIKLDSVLLVGSREETIIGRPYIQNAVVTCKVEEVAKDKKVYAYKFRRRKNSQRLKGHRRRLAILRVTDISDGSY